MSTAFGFLGLFTIGRHDRGISRLFGHHIHLTETYFIVGSLHSVWWAEMLMAFLAGITSGGHDDGGGCIRRVIPAAAVVTFIGFNLTSSAIHPGNAGDAAALCILFRRSFKF